MLHPSEQDGPQIINLIEHNNADITKEELAAADDSRFMISIAGKPNKSQCARITNEVVGPSNRKLKSMGARHQCKKIQVWQPTQILVRCSAAQLEGLVAELRERVHSVCDKLAYQYPEVITRPARILVANSGKPMKQFSKWGAPQIEKTGSEEDTTGSTSYASRNTSAPPTRADRDENDRVTTSTYPSKATASQGEEEVLPTKFKSPQNSVPATAEHDEQRAELVQSVRHVMRVLTHPAVVILAKTPSDRSKGLPDPYALSHGVTVSSLTSVTLQPRPIVMFNIKLPSRSWDAIYAAGAMRIHILAANETGVAIADAFARPGKMSPFKVLEKRSKLTVRLENGRAPAISHPTAVLSRMNADLLPEKCTVVGDHVIAVAEIKHVSEVDSKILAMRDAGLAYADQKYRALGPAIEAPAAEPVEREIFDALADLADVRAEVPAFAPTQPTRGVEFYMSKLGPKPKVVQFKSNANTAKQPPRQRGNLNGSLSGSLPNWKLKISKKKAGQGREFHTSVGYSASKNTTKDTGSEGESAPSSYSSYAPKDLIAPGASTLTVADFLGFPDDNQPPASRPPRLRSLIRANTDKQWAQGRLERISEGLLEPAEGEVERLEKLINATEHRIDKRLASIAAADLQLMLDKGRHDFARATWLESTIERGLAATDEDLRRVQKLRDQRRIDAVQYDRLMERLNAEHAYLTAEASRLRNMLAEEDDD